MMIIPDDQAARQSLDAKTGFDVGPDEPPPTYSPPAASVTSSSDAPSSTTFKTKPTNFLALFNEGDAIRGEFVIDPTIRIPSSMLPPLGDGDAEDDRKNLCLRSKNSSVHADMWLLGSPSAHKPPTRRTSIALTSDHGSIHAQLHTLDSPAPFSLTANAPHGAVRLSLPRSFEGLLSLSTRHGSITVSDPLVQNATQLGQLGLARRYFVGDFSLLGEGEWEGDQVEVEAHHGSIRVRYVDEGVDERKKGLFSRLFGK